MYRPRSLRRPRNPVLAGVLLGGAANGLVAGLVMAIAAVWHAASYDVGGEVPMLQIAAFWQGVEAIVGAWPSVVLGLGTHLVVSMMLGVVFAALRSHRANWLGTLAWSLLYATIVWFVMTYVVLPMVNPVMHERVRWTPEAWFLLHLAWGAALSASPAFERVFARRPATATIEIGRQAPIGDPVPTK